MKKLKIKLEIEFTPCDDSPPGLIYPEDTGISEALKVIGKEIIKVLKKNPGMYVDTVGVKECNRT